MESSGNFIRHPSSGLVDGVGSNPIIFLVRGDIDISGTIDVGARKQINDHAYTGFQIPGPGGFFGGDAGQFGFGDCSGGTGTGGDCHSGCASGRGGGGGSNDAGDAGGGGGCGHIAIIVQNKFNQSGTSSPEAITIHK